MGEQLEKVSRKSDVMEEIAALEKMVAVYEISISCKVAIFLGQKLTNLFPTSRERDSAARCVCEEFATEFYIWNLPQKFIYGICQRILYTGNSPQTQPQPPLSLEMVQTRPFVFVVVKVNLSIVK